ncbi:MAG: SDR family oxidoreductase [Deltaproteobacteria bacterium]|nr:SDR family oxidoreductase [Deltaproteobacteria bacterium]MBW2446606.1 SDR family oxidoreductase [Deltaproteobacteria bacterium]
MELGIGGRRAIVCASSRGLGRACAEALAREGVHVTLNGREPGPLRDAEEEIATRHGVEVESVVGDIGAEETQQALLSACPAPDILVNNNGGPPPGRFQDWDRETWVGALDANMLAPLLMIRRVLDGMVERKFGRIVNITSAMVKTPLAPMGLSTGARTGLTSVSKALSRDVAHANVTLNNLLPERIDTARQRGMAELRAKLGGVTIEQAYDEMKASIAAGRLGRPEEFGDACAFLCSAQAGFISGQNLQLDGGSYAGLI